MPSNEGDDGGDVDLEAALRALSRDDLDALREALGERWWVSRLQMPHYRSPDGEHVLSTYGIWKEHNHGMIDEVGEPGESSTSLDQPTLRINGEPWKRLSDAEVLAYYAEKDDTKGLGFLLSLEEP